MAALKERMVARINAADPPLKKADLMLRGFAGELTGANQGAITATLATGRDEVLPWSELGSQAPGKLLQLVVEKASGDDWLSCGVFALSIGDVELAERLLARAGEMGIDIGPYRGPLAQAAFDAARALLDAGEFVKALDALAAVEKKYAGTPWLAARRTAIAAARVTAEQGAHENEAERLYAEAVGHFEKEQLFDLRPLVERLKTEYANTDVVTDDARKPPFAELEKSVADLGQMFTVRQDGKGDFKSIQEAIDAAPPNSLIEIQDNGPYKEVIMLNKPGTTLRGKKENWPIITSAGLPTAVHILVRVSASHVHIEQVVIVHALAGGTHSRSLAIHANPCRLARAVVYGVWDTSVDVASISDFDHVVMAANANAQGGSLHVSNSFWLGGSPLYLVRGGKFDNVLLPGMQDVRHPIELSQCTIRGELYLPQGSVLSNSIVPSVRIDKGDALIEFCNVHGQVPFVNQAKPGKGCFSAPPMFVAPKDFDYRLMPGSPCIGKASDGGDIGVRWTPEMIEMLKLALELRSRGIIKF
jgi:tetratricopeptide (TPR) repeat protein